MEIFVFGSNLEGRHGKGAALTALRNYGAIRGQGEGLQGRSYAIPTKETPYKTLPLTKIEWYVWRFLTFATDHPEMTFRVTKIGCGLAGYTEDQIAPLFDGAPDNVILPEGWRQICG